MSSLKIIKEKRKTISLKIDDDLSISIKAPIFCSNKEIDNFIKSKKNWITKTKKHIKNAPTLIKIPFKIGDTLYYLGDPYIIKNKSRSIIKTIDTQNNILFNITNTSNPHEEILTQLKKIASDILLDRIDNISKKVKLHPKKTTIKSLKSRWGSCSSLKNINLNWKLIHAPINIIDYVIIHELCHLTHMNHSKQFWLLVKKFDPNYQSHQSWLKKNGNFIRLNY